MAGKKKGGTGRAFRSKAAANKRTYRKVYSSNISMVRVPKACALVKVSKGRTKIRKGCKIRKNGAWCDPVTRMPKEATRKGVTVKCK